MLPRGQWVTIDSSDVTQELSSGTAATDDPQLADVPPATAKASPAQQPGGLTAIGGGRT
jgi:hypothetical protein